MKSRIMRWMGLVSRTGRRRVVYRFLSEKHEGKKPLGRPRIRQKDNIKMDLQEMGWWDGMA